MNAVQRMILIAGGSLMVLSCIYVPWVGGNVQYPKVKAIGYSLIWIPPSETIVASVDVPRFLIQTAGLGLFTAIAYVVATAIRNKP